ncbi:hypothetical protein [Halostella sp. PRR32]|uniref:hypothetical protein n=1 Tax=Halostella sp. PRR32 TaxID=3098147 RepID=UPI002B1CE4F9|nr:hypothetical protein [Halostella sp. PRR32]
MVDPVASPSDVKVEYATTLDDSTINNYLERAARENARHNDPSAMSDADRTDLEAALAAYWIATRSADRAESSTQSGRTSVDYESSVVEQLEATIRNLDPSGELPPENKPQASFEVF